MVEQVVITVLLANIKTVMPKLDASIAQVVNTKHQTGKVDAMLALRGSITQTMLEQVAIIVVTVITKIKMHKLVARGVLVSIAWRAHFFIKTNKLYAHTRT